MSGPFAALNGRRIISGAITFPYYGAWVADVVLSVADTIPTLSTLTLEDLTLAGAVYRQFSFAGSRSARLVGGFGGWRKQVPAQAYQNAAGLKASLLLGDAAALVGERVNVVSDQTVGTLFVREAAPAQRLLRQIAGSIWWIDASGTTQVGPRTGSPIMSSFTAIQWSGAKGRFEIATEKLSDWMPGQTFSSPTVTATQTIGATSIAIDNDGTLRLTVLSTP